MNTKETGFILTHPNGHVEILRDRGPDGYEMRECKIEAITFGKSPSPATPEAACNHSADKLYSVHFGREGTAHWCMACGAMRHGTGNLWMLPASPPAARCECPQHGTWLAADDIYRMVRELDVAMNGDKAAKQASLCDIVGQLKEYIEAAKADVVVSAAQGQKAVAWLYTRSAHGNEYVLLRERDPGTSTEFGWTETPLFASPVPASGEGWRPIETAPKDGTTIDLWDDDWKIRICNARWAFHYWLEGRPQGDKAWGPDHRDGPFCSHLTHWMPLPAAPAVAVGETK